ncbi:hypothetical protein [Cedratvirus kamchatka]|uniref:Uncharacterized protein n=1 Tax=Cedratvirus kamchatka TaxID=2716914 RepID=A0A6G8MX82_9VIRU|nr:hypothetical protein [Cedratvirus kamchatka]
MSYPMYDQVDLTKIMCSKPEKKEYTDEKTQKKGTYHIIPISYDKGDSTGPFYYRLPIYKFWPLTDESDSLAMIHDSSNPDHKQLQQFYTALRKKGGEFIFKHQDDIDKSFDEENIAVGMLSNPVYVKKENGKTKGNGTTYFKLLRGSVSSNSTLFIGPDRKVYPKKRFYGYTIEGSGLVRVDSIYSGSKISYRQSMVQIDIKTVKKLNSEPIDNSVPEEDDETKQAFLEALGDEEEEVEKTPSSTPPKVSEKVKDETMDFLNSVNSNPMGKEKPVMPE